MKKLSSFLNLLIASLAIIIAGAFFYVKYSSDFRKPAKESETDVSSQDLDKIVNKYIKKTSEESLRVKIEAQKSLLETKKKLDEIAKAKRIKQDRENAKIPLDRQLNKNNPDQSPNTPAEIINSKLYNNIMQEQQEQQEEDDKNEYARQWIENARKAGYLLELSPDLEVIRYTPIRKPSQQDDSMDANQSD